MTPPSGLMETSRSRAVPSRSSVAARPNSSSSSGTGGASRSTSLSEETITMNRSAAAATAFSRVWAAPPPFTSQPDGATWSAPSIATSSRASAIAPRNGSTLMPRSRAMCSVAGEVATQRRSSPRSASAGSRYATVEPVPRPTVMPSSTSCAAASAASFFSCATLIGPRLRGCVNDYSRPDADDRLPADPLGRIEARDGIVEGRDVADVRPQPPVAHPLDDLTQLGTVGLDDEVDRRAVRWPRLGRPGDGHQRPSGANQACGPLLDLAADDIEHQIDTADVFQRVVVEVDELHRAEVERLLTVGGAPGADDVGAELTCELRDHRPDCAGRAVHEHALPRSKTAMLEQSLPRGQARHRQARGHREVDVARQRREVACLDRHILRQPAAA